MNKETQAAILRAAGRYIEKRLAPIEPRLKALEDRKIIKGEDGKDGRDGKDADPVDQAAIVAEVLKQIPSPKDGRDGIDAPGLDAVVEALTPAVQKHLESIPKPKDGERGEDGKSLTLDDIAPLLKSMQAEWALDFERRAQALFQKAVDEMPKPKDGKDGVDGVGWDSMRVEHDGRRSFELIFTKGQEDHAFKFAIPCVIDAGFYREGMAVEKGDGVTFGGSYWIAQKDTDSKPEIGNPDWRLAVKKGRDGKRD